MKVRKKPVIVEAWQVVSRDFDLPSWINEALYVPVNERTMFWNLDDLTELKIQTLEGLMTAKIGDYIIKGVEGELYPVRKDIFEKTYEVVE